MDWAWRGDGFCAFPAGVGSRGGGFGTGEIIGVVGAIGVSGSVCGGVGGVAGDVIARVSGEDIGEDFLRFGTYKRDLNLSSVVTG
jgi:hypothetical protein